MGWRFPRRQPLFEPRAERYVDEHRQGRCHCITSHDRQRVSRVEELTRDQQCQPQVAVRVADGSCGRSLKPAAGLESRSRTFRKAASACPRPEPWEQAAPAPLPARPFLPSCLRTRCRHSQNQHRRRTLTLRANPVRNSARQEDIPSRTEHRLFSIADKRELPVEHVGRLVFVMV